MSQLGGFELTCGKMILLRNPSRSLSSFGSFSPSSIFEWEIQLLLGHCDTTLRSHHQTDVNGHLYRLT